MRNKVGWVEFNQNLLRQNEKVKNIKVFEI